MLNLNHLYYFYVAAQHKTITNAAKSIGISQPSLTSQIKLLEGQLDRALFRRTGRNVFLTLDGERLFKLTQPIFEAVSELERKVHQQQHSTHATLRIGFTEQIEGMFIAELVSKIIAFKKWTNPPKLIITCAKKEQIVNQLKANEIDLAFANSNTADPEIETIQHFRVPVGVYLSKDQMKKVGKKTFNDLMKDRTLGLALPNSQVRLRHEIDDYLEQQKIKKHVLFESDTLSLVTRAVVDHVGLGFFPKPYMAEEEKLNQVVCVSGKTNLWNHSMYLISHHQFEQTETIKEMIIMIRKIFIQFDASTFPVDKVKNRT
jgi:DNA-binding transcriptional LysR family regulator